MIPTLRNSLKSNKRNSEIMISKVPQQMTLTLKKKKSQQYTANMLNLYSKAKSVIAYEDCSICQSPILKGFSIADCEHIFCEDCLAHYLTYKIDSMEEIICPNEGCDKKLDVNCQLYLKLPQKYKEKHKSQQLWSQTIKNPDLKICPLQNCKQGVVNLRKIPPECQKCKTKFCQQCMMKEHSGKPCDANFQQNFKQWKRCPKCRMFIQKSEGCNHMTCLCKHQFCFVCLADFDNQHYNCGQLVFEQVEPQKSIAFAMIILFPLALLLGIVVSLILMAGSFILGFFIGIGLLCTLASGNSCLLLLLIIFIPVIGIVSSIFSLCYGTYMIISAFANYSGRYFRAIRYHCR